MRNIFDQYANPENRLTHALVSSIAQDQYLLREFIKWTTGHTLVKKETIYVIEQSLPDQLEEPSDRVGFKPHSTRGPAGRLHIYRQCLDPHHRKQSRGKEGLLNLRKGVRMGAGLHQITDKKYRELCLTTKEKPEIIEFKHNDIIN